MSETVIKTVLDVDKLFSEIEVNGENHVSERYEAPPATPVPTAGAVPPAQSQTPASTPAQNEPVQGSDVYAVELNDVLHNFIDRAVTEGLQTEVTARQESDQTLQTNVSVVAGDVVGLMTDVDNIEELVPEQASAQNQLADKNFVNSSIATNTANFLGSYSSMAEIEAIPNPTNNDYAYLETTDSAGNTVIDRYKYNADSQTWLFEYELNNSGFTAQQWATINSGLTQQSVDASIQQAINNLVSNVTITENTAMALTKDFKIFVNGQSLTLTLNFQGSVQGSVADIFAMNDCTVVYETDLSTTEQVSMQAGTRIRLLYFNGWKYCGEYGAVWN